MAFSLGTSDLRFLLSRVRWDWLPEEQGGVVPLGPTGIRRVQGIGNHSRDPLSPNWWFGAGDTLFPRLTFNRLTAPGGKAVDKISRPFATAIRGKDEVITIGNTVGLAGAKKDALNMRTISNLIADSTDTIGFSSLDTTDPDYALKLQLKLQDDPTGRVSPTSGAVNPLVYSNFMSALGQFFDHGLDFVNKGADGKVKIELLPSDGLFTAGRATTITGSRSNTVTINWGEGSNDALLTKMGIDLNTQGVNTWDQLATITTPGRPDANGYVYEGRLVLNGIFIEVAAFDIQSLVNELNDLSATTGVTVTAGPAPAFGGIPAGSYQLVFTPAKAESFNEISPFIDLSQNYGSDDCKMLFLREYLSVSDWKTATGNTTSGVEPTWTELITGRLMHAGATVNGESAAGLANWAQIKSNALKLGITLHDADVNAIPLVAMDGDGNPILGADGLPQLIALNKVTGETVYVKDTDLSIDPATSGPGLTPGDYVLATTRHAFLNDKAFNWQGPLVQPGQSGFNTDPQNGSVRDLVDPSILNAHLVTGDGRANENIGLTSIHEIFLNEHNRLITQLKTKYGFTGEQPDGGWDWTDPLTNVSSKITGEELFQQAKLLSEMIYQHMIFAEFNRKISPNIGGFAAVNPAIDARVSVEFASAVYRFGHSMLAETMGLMQLTDASHFSTTTVGDGVVTVNLLNHGLQDGTSVTIEGVNQAIDGISAAELNGTYTITVDGPNSFFFTTTGIATSVIGGLAADKVTIDMSRGLIEAFTNPLSYTPGSTPGQTGQGTSNQVGMRIDEKVTDALRDNLLGQPLDLASLNIMRGRDAGIPTLNELRASLQLVAPPLLVAGLNPYNSWTSFRNALKGTLDDQNATAKNFIMGYASDDLFTKFGAQARAAAGPGYELYTTLDQWYALRASVVPAEQDAYMSALKAAADAAFGNATWMGTTANANKDFNFIDGWTGGLAEREVVGGMLGTTFNVVFAMQNQVLQDADNFYYLGRVPATEFFNDSIDGTLMADLVMRNSTAQYLYSDIFSVPDSRVDIGDAGQPARVASLAALQASTTNQQVFDAAGNVIFASIGRSGWVGTTNVNQSYYGNPGDYADARGVLNPNGVGNASEVIVGTSSGERIFAGGGNDAVYGEAGNDSLFGESGVDFLHSGDGNDSIDGGSEDDLLYGEGGNDTMRGGVGLELMFGGEGNDSMYGGLDADLMIGGFGSDLMYGGDGIVDVNGVLDPEPVLAVALVDDAMHGGEGEDTLYGGGGWDGLVGESGHDILIPGAGGIAQGGRDAMNGGQGDDIYISDSIALFDFQDFSDSGLTALQLVNKGASFRGVGNGLGIDEVRFSQTVAEDIVIGITNVLGVAQVFTGIERVVIGTGTATAANRTGTAAINIDASLANVGLTLGLEILGNAGTNTIVGTLFSDTIDGGLGADTMQGEIGDDTYILNQATDVVIELGSGGTDTVVIDGGFNYTLGDQLENLTLLTSAGASQGTGNALNNWMVGNGSNNVLVGLAGNDRIIAAAGNDTIFGGAGIDNLTGGIGADRFVFGADITEIGNNPLRLERIGDFFSGTDKLDFSAPGYPQFAFIEANQFSGASQLRLEANVLYGDVNGDTVSDFQLLLAGVTTLQSTDFILAPVSVSVARPIGVINEGNTGSSAHTFTVSLNTAALVNITTNWAVTGTGANAANAADFTGNAFPRGTVTIAAGQTSATITVNVAGDTTVEQSETFLLTLSNPVGGNVNLGTASATSTIVNDDVLVGQVLNGNGNGNTINGTAGNDTMDGAGGNDSLNGLAGDDSLSGGTGNDTLNGGIFNDTLIGGAGLDRLTGGLNNDTFVYTLTSDSPVGNNRDVIVDFVSGLDKVDVSAIDANTNTGGNGTFSFIGAGAFTGLGQARYAGGLLEFNNTGNNGADMQIALTGAPTLLGTDIIL